MAKADPKLSEGARLERKAVLTYVRRKRRKMGETFGGLALGEAVVLDEVIAWMVQRESRYSARPGGLGRSKAR